MSTSTAIQNIFRTKEGNRLVIDAKISKTNHKYFSITASEYSNRKEETVCCGCMHDTIMEVAPQYADFIAMHLSDIDGIPMHAVENGYYYYQNTGKFGLTRLSEHLRLSIEDTKELINALNSIQNNEERKIYFSGFVKDQVPRWKQEAENLIKKYNLKIPA